MPLHHDATTTIGKQRISSVNKNGGPYAKQLSNDLGSFCHQRILTDAKPISSSSARPRRSNLFTGCASCDSAAMTPYLLSPPATAAPDEPIYSTQYDDRSTDNVMGDIFFSSISSANAKNEDSFKTVLSYLQKNDQWVLHMDTVDQLETITFLRVMYLGVATSEERRLVLKKLSDGLSRSLLPHTTGSTDSTPSETSSSPSSSIINIHGQPNTPLAYGFRERKYHLLPLHFFSTDILGNDGNDDDHTAVFEDNGVHIVEADFTTDNQHRQDPNLILSYIYHHCRKQQQVSASTLQLILNLSSPDQLYRGSIYNDGNASTNGIDLCIYFYRDASNATNINKELDLLWKINALQIPILPILSMPNHTLRPVHRDSTPNTRQRATEIRRSELAQLFSLWRIKTMDFSNLDMLEQPSFQRKGRSRKELTPEDRQIEKRLGPLWTSSSIVTPTPYHILTLFQFLAIDKWAISKLINAIKIQKRRNDSSASMTTNDLTKASASTATDSTSSAMINHSLTLKPGKGPDYSTPSSFLSGSKYWIPGNTTGPSTRRHLLYAIPILLLLTYGLLITLTRHPPSWNASLALISYLPSQSMTLTLNVYDHYNQPRWTPEPPLIETNILWSSSGRLIVAPSPNKTRSVDGQYFYTIDLPPCNTLEDTETIIVQVKPSMVFTATSRIQGNPLHLSRHLLCDPTIDSSPPIIAWRHFRQHSHFYLMNSIKILQWVFTEGID